MSDFFARLTGSLTAFFSNPIILSALASWFFCQFMKGIIALVQVQKKRLREVLETVFWRTGGMPSSHAAVVTSMTVAVAFHEGIGSNLFAVSLVIAMVVMRDAMGVRRSVGLQASSLNLLGRHSSERLGLEFSPLKEIRGHAPLEVVVGALLGLIISAVFALL